MSQPGSDREWRVGHRGRDQMYYEERHGGRWERLEVDGEMLMGSAHHVIYFATPAQWSKYPGWAQGRRDEIITRIKSEFRPPDYEYNGDQAGRCPSSTGLGASVPPAARSHRVGRAQPTEGRAALLVAVALLLALAGGMGSAVVRGVVRGQTRVPIKPAYLRRPVLRQQDPVMYWTAIGLYTMVGAGAVILGVLGAREWRRLG